MDKKKIEKYSRDGIGKGVKIGKTVIKTKIIVVGLILVISIVGIIALVQLTGFQRYWPNGGAPVYEPSTEYDVGIPVLDVASHSVAIGKNIKLEWELESPFIITGFIIFQSISNVPWIPLAFLGNVYTYTYSPSTETEYGFMVMGVATIDGAEHLSQYSNVQFVQVFSQAAGGAPVLKVIESPNTDGTVELDWDAVAGPYGGTISGYRIYRQIGSGGWIEIDEVLSGITDYIDNVSVNGTYQYYIRTVTYIDILNSELISDPSNTQIVVVALSDEAVSNDDAPETPVLETIDPATDIDGEINLEWDSVEGADDYEIQRKKDDESWIIIKDDYTSTDYTDEILESGEYKYRIKAQNDYGDSSFSNEESVSVEIPTNGGNLPENPSISINNGAITTNSFTATLSLSCDNAEKMRFKLSTDTDWTEYESFSTTKTVILPESSVDNPYYYIKVQFWNTVGETGENDAIDGITYDLEGEPPPVPPEDKDDELDYTLLYILIAVLGGTIGIVVFIQYRKKKDKRVQYTTTKKNPREKIRKIKRNF